MTEVEEIQKDFAAYIKKHGIGNVPLYKPELLPLLDILWKIHEEKDEAMLVAFDFNIDPPQKLYHGLMMPIAKASGVAERVMKMIVADAKLVELRKSGAVKDGMTMTMAQGVILLYHDELYVPVESLGKRKH